MTRNYKRSMKKKSGSFEQTRKKKKKHLLRVKGGTLLEVDSWEGKRK